MKQKHFIGVLIISIFILVLDLLFKYLYIFNLPHNFYKEIIPGFLSFFVEHNQFIAFSIPIPQTIILIAIPIIILGLIVYLIRNFNSYFHQWGILILIVGALSNWVDRVYLGYVLDFIKIPYWPVFNFADVLVVVGVCLVVLGELSIKSFSKKML